MNRAQAIKQAMLKRQGKGYTPAISAKKSSAASVMAAKLGKKC